MGVIDHGERLFRVLSRIRQFGRYSLGRVLGTVGAREGRYLQAISDLERSHFMRVELNALTKILLDKGILTQEQFTKATADEAEHYEKRLREMFPEVTPAEDGGSFTLNVALAQKRVMEERWPK